MSQYPREMKHTCVLYYFPHAACFTYLQPSEIAQAPALSRSASMMMSCWIARSSSLC